MMTTETNPNELPLQQVDSQPESSNKETKSIPDIPGSFPILGPISSYLQNKLPQPIVLFINKYETMIEKHPILLYIKKYTRLVQPTQVIIASILFYYLFSKHPVLASYFINLYPMYYSIRGIERPRLNDDERLLTYWSIVGALLFLEYHIKSPFYYKCKILFLGWLQKNGALVVYRSCIRPLLFLQ